MFLFYFLSIFYFHQITERKITIIDENIEELNEMQPPPTKKTKLSKSYLNHFSYFSNLCKKRFSNVSQKRVSKFFLSVDNDSRVGDVTLSLPDIMSKDIIYKNENEEEKEDDIQMNELSNVKNISSTIIACEPSFVMNDNQNIEQNEVQDENEDKVDDENVCFFVL